MTTVCVPALEYVTVLPADKVPNKGLVAAVAFCMIKFALLATLIVLPDMFEPDTAVKLEVLIILIAGDETDLGLGTEKFIAWVPSPT